MPPGGKESFNSFLDIIEDSSKSITLATFFLNVVLSQSLGPLWDAINVMQLIVHMSMFSAMVPVNVVFFD